MSTFDDLSPRDAVSISKKMIRAGESLWPITPKIRHDMVHVCESFMRDDDQSPTVRLSAVANLMEMQKQNIVAEKMLAEGEERIESGPKVVLLLPPNGSEKKETT